jgi:hypothetical protein
MKKIHPKTKKDCLHIHQQKESFRFGTELNDDGDEVVVAKDSDFIKGNY